MSFKRMALVLALGAALGFSVFGYLVSRVSSFEERSLDAAIARVDSLRAHYESSPRSGEISIIHVMLYGASREGLYQVDIPLWFIELKAPALRFVLRGTDVDLEELGLSPDTLRARGPAILVDEARANGDRLLIWSD